MAIGYSKEIEPLLTKVYMKTKVANKKETLTEPYP